MRNGVESMGRVVARKTDENGMKTGKSNSNPLMDSREYLCEFLDGSTDAYTANIIAQLMFSQIDDKGNSFSIIQDSFMWMVPAESASVERRRVGFLTAK